MEIGCVKGFGPGRNGKTFGGNHNEQRPHHAGRLASFEATTRVKRLHDTIRRRKIEIADAKVEFPEIWWLGSPIDPIPFSHVIQETSVIVVWDDCGFHSLRPPIELVDVPGRGPHLFLIGRRRRPQIFAGLSSTF